MIILNKIILLNKLEAIKNFYYKHQDKIYLTIGMILVGIVCFGLGRMTKFEREVPIEITNNTEDLDISDKIPSNEDNSDFLGKYVGSLSGSVYYIASNSKIDEIGEDNLIWFDSSEDAQEQGYTNKDLVDQTDEDSDNNTGSGKYVASKNGTKYYLPTCSGVKRIKEENKVYFNSVEEAEAEGLEPAKNCPGLE